MDNNFIDKMVQDALGDYEMAFDSSDWDAMEEQLEQDTQMRRKLYFTKGIEVCLMALAIWTTVQFVQIDSAATNFSATPSTEQIAPNAEQAPQNGENTIAPVQSEHEDAASEEERLKFNAPNQQVPSRFEGMPIAGAQDNNDKLIAQNSETGIKKKTVIDNALSTTLAVEKGTAQPAYGFRRSSKAEPNALLTSLEPKLFAVDNMVDLEPLGIKKIKASRKDSRFSIAGFMATDFVRIKTPFYALAEKKAHLFNASGGVLVDKKINDKLRIETGAVFALRKQTENEKLVNSNLYIVAEQQTVSTTSLEIPVHAVYNLYHKKNTNIYGVAGVSNHFTTTVRTRPIQYMLMNGSFDQMPLATVGLDNRTSPSNEGMFNGGSVTSNHFLSLNAGARVEQQLNDKYAVFAQVTYKQGLNNVGPQEDKISTLSLATGMKRAL